MRKHLQSLFTPRQHMLAKNFELYYYNDRTPTNVTLHSHPYYEFYFFLEGDVRMQIKETPLPLKHGDLLLIPPGTPHRLVIHDRKIPYRRFVLWISQEYCQRLFSLSPDYAYLIKYVQKNERYTFHNDQITFNSIQSRLLRILEEMHAHRFGRDTQISLCINDLILFLNRLTYEQDFPRVPKGELSLYQKLLEYIEEHIEENLSFDRLSQEFFVSRYHIAHVFKDNIGMSIHQYITKKRLALAKEALLGKAEITQIYQSFGFGDYSSFYRAFKKEYGVSPKEFRDMQISIREFP